MERTIVSSRAQSLLSSHRVLRNTYFLLALTLAFSASVAFFSISFNLPTLTLWPALLVTYGLLFLTHYTANSPYGILSTFALTGFFGYTLAPTVASFIQQGASDTLIMALGGTALVFFGCSAYVLTTKKDLSLLGGTLFSGAIVLLLSMLANFFLKIPALSLAISALFILFSSGAILLKTSEIIRGGERNYIRATVALYVALYNIFVSLLSLLSARRGD